MFSGQFKQRCVNIETGVVLKNYFCGYKHCPGDNYFADGTLDANKSQYFCGKTNQNPFYGVTSFDHVFSALLIILQTVTLEGWTSVMQILEQTMSPFAVLFFIPIVFIGAFFLLNLTLAVINSKFNDAHKEQQRKKNRKVQINRAEEEEKNDKDLNSQEKNVFKRYIIAKRAAKKMVEFYNKRRTSPIVSKLKQGLQSQAFEQANPDESFNDSFRSN